MSQFAGYVLPGSVFIAFGLKWSLDATSDNPPDIYSEDHGHHRCSSSTSSSCTSRLSSRMSKRRRRRCDCFCCSCRTCRCRLRNWPLEGFTKLGISLAGVVSSLYSAYPQGEFKFVGELLYATIYLFFALSGLVDVLVFYCHEVMPFGLGQFCLALAFFMEGLMYNIHRTQTSLLEQHVHTLLVCVIFGCALITLAEIVMPWSRITRFGRAFTTLLHGSWYIQTGFILYNPNSTHSMLTWSSSEDFTNALIWISLTFAWHSAGALVIMLILMALSRKRKPIHVPPPLPPPLQYDTEPHSSIQLQESQHQRSLTSIPRCQFSSSLSNYPDLSIKP